MHGAAQIMRMKNEKVGFSDDQDIDIDKLIEEGERRHREIKEMAAARAEQVKTDIALDSNGEGLNNGSAFDFNMSQINSYVFQDRDYREEKDKIKEILKEQSVTALEQ